MADPGEGPRGALGPPYLQTKLRPEGRKNLFGDRATAYVRVWMAAPPTALYIIFLRNVGKE